MTYLIPTRKIERVIENLPVRQINTTEDAQALCDYVGYAVTPDVRMLAWDIEVESIKPFRISGFVSNPHSVKALIRAAESIRESCEASQVQTPLDGVIFGRVNKSESPLCMAIDHPERSDTATSGDSLIILRRMDKFSLVHVENGYIGWVNNDDYEIITEEEWMDHISLKDKHSPTQKILCASAKSLLSTPYVWGGVSQQGIDCSGFTRFVYKTIGMNLPRDADQQLTCGIISAIPRYTKSMAAGDLLFFSGEYGGISHVGMALSNIEFIHAKGGKGVIISGIYEDELLMKRFIMGKRVLNLERPKLQNCFVAE